MTKVYLREWRYNKDVSQAEIARRIGASKAEISRLESGSRRLTHGWMDKIAVALGVDVTDLYKSPVGQSNMRQHHETGRLVVRPPPVANQNMGAGCPTVFALKPSRDNLQIVSIESDEMNPTLRAGDAVLVDKSKIAPVPAGLFLISELAEPVIRRLRVNPLTNMASVSVDNAGYETYEIEAHKVKILGRVIAHISQL